MNDGAVSETGPVADLVQAALAVALALTDRLADGEPCRLCGDTPDEIAAEMGTSRRTVYRLKHRCAALTEVRQ